LNDLDPMQALAIGHPIPLRDGTSPELMFTFRSLALLEARFGSVQGIQDAVDQTGNGAAFGPILDLIGAGLVSAGFTPHVRHRQDASGHRTVEEILYRRSSDGRELGDLMTPANIATYTESMQGAFAACFGTGQGNDAGPALADPSPGPTSSTSAPSS
jgi:hypothetical protein